MEKSVKDLSLGEMFQAMYRHDFNKTELVKASTLLKCGEVSHEDQLFMEIVDRGTSKKNDHYVVPLPFRAPSLKLPNNRKHAIQRLMGLKRRFMKDNKFFQDYLSFMENLLRSGYAKGSDDHQQGRLDIFLTMECITLANQAKSVLCLTAVQDSKEGPSTRSCYQDQI